MGVITFNGRSSDEFGCTIEERPNHTRGSRRGQLVEIPGRNGEISVEDDSYSTYTQKYKLAFKEGSTMPTYKRAAQVAQWLLGARGFCRLEDSFEPDVFRMVRYSGDLNIEQVAAEYGEAEIEFTCQPQRYLKSGETSYKFSAGNARLNIAVNPIPNGVESVRLDSYGTSLISAASASLMVYDSNDESDYTLAEMETDSEDTKHLFGTVNVGEYDAILVDAPMLVTSHLTYIYADGSTENIAVSSGISFALNNPTSQTAQPLIRFATTEHAPVNQTLTYVADSFIDPNGKISTAVAQSVRGRYRTTSPVSVSGYNYAYVTGRAYTFLDGNGNSVGFSPYTGSQSNEFHNTMLTIPSGAATIVIGGNTDDDFALALQEATPSQTTGSIAVNSTVASVNLRNGDVVYLDCDLHDAYYPGGGNANAAVSFEGADEYPTFPSLVPGTNMISVVNTEHFEVEIIPRWWVL